MTTVALPIAVFLQDSRPPTRSNPTEMGRARNPFALAHGNREALQKDFYRSFGEDWHAATAEELADWVRNTELPWERIRAVLNRTFGAMLWDTRLQRDWVGDAQAPTPFHHGFCWGLDSSPTRLRKCFITDFLQLFIPRELG